MYNRTGWWWIESAYSTVGEGKVLFNRIAKPGMFGLGMAPKKNFFANKTCTWKRGHGRHWYVRKGPHPGRVDIRNYVKTCITFYVFCLFIYMFVCFDNIFTFLYLQCLICVS